MDILEEMGLLCDTEVSHQKRWTTFLTNFLGRISQVRKRTLLIGIGMTAGVAILLLSISSGSKSHLYETDDGIIELSHIKEIKTGMSFSLKALYGYDRWIDIGPDSPITKETIQTAKNAARKVRDSFSGPWHKKVSVCADAYVKLDGRKIRLEKMNGYTCYDVERCLDHWFEVVTDIYRRKP